MTLVKVVGAQKLVLALAISGGAVAGAGGFYLVTEMTAQVVNREQSVTFGTLILSNQVGDGTACFSAPDLATDRNEQPCDAAFDLRLQKPGDHATVNIQISNVGVLGASALRVYLPTCVDGNAETFHATGSACEKLQLYIQLWTDRTRSVPAACVYGGAADGRRCDHSDGSKTVAAFLAAHASSATGIVVGPLPSGSTDYFTVGARLPPETDNSVQGRRATLSLAWHVTQ